MIVHPRRADIRVPEPLLNLRNIGASVQRIRRGRGAGGMRAESLHADPAFLP